MLESLREGKLTFVLGVTREHSEVTGRLTKNYAMGQVLARASESEPRCYLT